MKKKTILSKYEITEHMRLLDIQEGDTPKEPYVRLKGNFTKWVKPQKRSMREISEVIFLENFLRMSK